MLLAALLSGNVKALFTIKLGTINQVLQAKSALTCSSATGNQNNVPVRNAAIQSLIQAGIVPSVERLEEFVAVSYQKADRDIRIHQAASSLADICRLQEENALRTSDELIELIKILDSEQFSLSSNPVS